MDCWVPVPQPPDRQPMPDSLPQAAATDRGAVQQLQEQLGRDGFARLLQTFLERAPGRLADLRTAAEAGDAAGVREHAHSLKGAARSFGAAEIGELALRLEQESAAGSLTGAHDLIAALETSLERTQAEFRSQLQPGGGAQPRSIRVLLADEESAPASAETRIADLERRVASLEQSMAGLLSGPN